MGNVIEDIKLTEDLIYKGYVHNRKYEWRGEDRGMYQVEVHVREGCPVCDRIDAWERLKQRLEDLYGD